MTFLHLSVCLHFSFFILIELAKKWDADKMSPSMILFQDGKPLTRMYEESFYLDIVAKVGKYCRSAGEEHKELK